MSSETSLRRAKSGVHSKQEEDEAIRGKGQMESRTYWEKRLLRFVSRHTEILQTISRQSLGLSNGRCSRDVTIFTYPASYLCLYHDMDKGVSYAP